RRHDVNQQKDHDREPDEDEEGRIRHRLDDFFPDADHQLEVADVAVEDLDEIAGVLTRADGGAVEIRKMLREASHGLGDGRPASDLGAGALQRFLEGRMNGALGQEVEDLQDRQTGPYQRDEFLVEDEELTE